MICNRKFWQSTSVVTLALAATIVVANPAQAAFFHTASGSIDGSLCVGFDCVSAESFGFDTIRLKENNLRIMFVDTSNSASFPNRDWQLVANSSGNGGLNYFGIRDCGTGDAGGASQCGNLVFAVQGGAPASALSVDAQGDVGLGVLNAALDLHIRRGDTPSIRLEQDGSSGFTPQTWDLAGNETNFFIRDATNGSQLPFRIRPGADSNSLFIDTDNDVGIGTASPAARLHVSGSSAVALKLENTGGGVSLQLDANSGADFWQMTSTANDNILRFNRTGGATEFELDSSGNLTISGNLVTGGGGTCDPGPCDLVFDPNVYQVPSIEDHAEQMWANKHLPAVGPTKAGEPINVTIKLTRMLNELETAHIYIAQLHEEKEILQAKVAQLESHESRLARLEELLKQ